LKPDSPRQAPGCCTPRFACLRTSSYLERSTGHLVRSTGCFVRRAGPRVARACSEAVGCKKCRQRWLPSSANGVGRGFLANGQCVGDKGHSARRAVARPAPGSRDTHAGL